MPIEVLGPVQISDRCGRAAPIAGRKARALLALLAIRANQTVSLDQLADELWFGAPQPGARTTIHAHVSRLRVALRHADACAELVTNSCGYMLHSPDDELDCARFETLARTGAAVASTSAEAAVSRLTRSLEEWRGSAFQELHDYEPLYLEAQRLEELRLVAVEERWAAELELGGHLVAIGQLQRLVVDHPYRERLQGLLLLALHRSGRQTEALRAYQVAVGALAEVGVVPGPDLRSLEQLIAAQDPALDHHAAATVRTPGECVPSEGSGSVMARVADAALAAERHATLVTETHATKAITALSVAGEHAARAADEALARRCPHEAIAHYRMALTVLELDGSSRPHRRVELQLACARACHVAYELGDALTMFRTAARTAASIGDVGLLNEAAAGLAFATEFAMADDETVAVLTGALRHVPDDCARRVELLAGLARTMPQDDCRSRAHAAEAVALARRLGDPRGLTLALSTSVLVSWGPQDARARLDMIDEVVELAEQLAWTDLLIEARNWRSATLRQLGRGVEAAHEAAQVERSAHESGRPFLIAVAAMRRNADLLEQRRFDELDDALVNPPPGAQCSPNFAEAAIAQLFLLRLAQHRASELVEVIETFLDGGQAPFVWRAAHVVALVDAGQRDPARAALRVEVTSLRLAPRNWLWLSAVALLSDACIALGDHHSAPVLAGALRGHRGETVVVAHGIATLGPVDARLDSLGRLASRMHRDRKECASALAQGGINTNHPPTKEIRT